MSDTRVVGRVGLGSDGVTVVEGRVPRSHVLPVEGGRWRAVWRGRAIQATFRGRVQALSYIDRCDTVGELVPLEGP